MQTTTGHSARGLHGTINDPNCIGPSNVHRLSQRRTAQLQPHLSVRRQCPTPPQATSKHMQRFQTRIERSIVDQRALAFSKSSGERETAKLTERTMSALGLITDNNVTSVKTHK
jgi:hypothetical protein